MTHVPSRDWPRAALGSLARFQNGFAFKPADWGKEGKPIIRIQNLTQANGSMNRTLREVPEKFHVYPGDLLYSWSATLGAYYWTGEDAYLNQHIFKVIPDKCVDKEYLYYVLQFVTEELSQKTHGSTMKHVTKGDFEGTEVPLPSLPEQRRIFDILNRANGIRRLRRETQEKARQIIPALFVEMFGDPASSKSGWPVRTLGDLVDGDRGISYGIVQRGPDVGDGVPVVRISNIVNNAFYGNEIVRTAPEISAQFRRTVLAGGELLLSIRGTVGRVAIAPELAQGWNVSREIAVIPLRGVIDREYARAVMVSDFGQRFLLREVRGVAQRGINLKDVRNLPIPLPPLPLQQSFASRASDIQAMIAQQDRMAEASEELIASLMGQAFDGELRRPV